MEFPALRGRSILVVEDEMLIGMDIRSALEEAGAHVTATTTVRHALILVSSTTVWQERSWIMP
jgi:CheY-like chemotaxis protein